MSKILLAIDNENIFKVIKQEWDIDIFEKDIVYKEGILEVLEKNLDINFIILNTEIAGNISIENFIEKIEKIRKDIKIIIFLKPEEEKHINFLNSKNINQIYKKEELKLEVIREILDNIFFEYKNIKKEIENLKNILGEKIEEKKLFSKLMIFIGENNVGKTIFSTTIAQIVENKKKKVLLISFDILKKDIAIIFGSETKINKIIKINEFIDIVFLKELETLKDYIYSHKYEFIIIDSSGNNEFIKYTFINNFRIFFIIEPSILGVNKANILLEKYIISREITVDNIEIIFNRYDNMSISKHILKEMFKKFKILGFCKNGRLNKFIKKKII